MIRCLIAAPSPEALFAVSRAARASGTRVEGECLRAGEALSMTRRLLPDALLLHAYLPGLSAQGLHGLSLCKYPAVILLSPARGEAGAPEGVCVSSRPSPEELRAALAKALPLPARADAVCRAEALLERMGLPPGKARAYLARAAAHVLNDTENRRRLSSFVYPEIAAYFRTTPRRASDAMRRAIESAWSTGDIERQYAYFGNTIDAGRGKPTCLELISTTAELMRLGLDRPGRGISARPAE